MPWHCFGINAFQGNMSSIWSNTFREDSTASGTILVTLAGDTALGMI